MFSRFITKRLFNNQSIQGFDNINKRINALSTGLMFASLGSILNTYAIVKIQDDIKNK